MALRFNHLSEFAEEVSADLSAGGLFVRTQRPHPVAGIFEFRLRPGDGLPVISGKAQVAWVRSHDEGPDRRAGMGARFVEIGDESLLLIQQLVDAHRRQEATPDRGVAAADPDADRRAVIADQLKTLRLPAFAREYVALARRARENGWAHEDFLRELLEAEIVSRRESTAARRLRAAQFPEHKTMDEIDWQALTGPSKPRLAELAGCAYIERAEDIVLTGPTGTGKTHLAIALGVEATRRRCHVLFRRTNDLVCELVEARDKRELGRLQRRLRRVDLLICDELGSVPLDEVGGGLLVHVLTERCGRRSTMMASDLPLGEWSSVFGDRRRAAALVDRLTSHAHLLALEGRSYRGRMRERAVD